MITKGKNSYLFVFEGADNVGKSTTMIKTLFGLYNRDIDKEFTISIDKDQTEHSTPTKILRQVLHDHYAELNPLTSYLIQLASRVELEKRLNEKLSIDNSIVLLDRYFPSTLVYQSKELGEKYVKELMSVVDKDVESKYDDCDIIFVFDKESPFESEDKDSIEDTFFYEDIRKGYLDLAESNIRKYQKISVDNKSPEEISAEVLHYIINYINNNTK